MPETQLFPLMDFAARVDKATKHGPPIDRALYFDTSARGVVDILIGLDAIICEDIKRYFPGAHADEFKNRLAALCGLSKPQIASAEAIIRGNATATETVRMCANFLINYVLAT